MGHDYIRDLRVLLLEPHLGYPRQDKVHAWHELVVVVRGYYRAISNSIRIEVPPGSAILYPAGTPHQPEPGDGRNLTFVCVMWTGGEPLGDGPIIAHDPSHRLALAATWLYDLALRKNESTAKTGLFIALLAEVRRCSQNQNTDDPIERLRGLLDVNFSISQHLPNLAALIGMSPTHLTRRFKARYGCTPMSYLRRRRLEAALAQIATRQGSLQEIAASCGLGRASYLSRLIRQKNCQPGALDK